MSDEMDEIWALFADDGSQAMDAMETALLALDGAPEAEQSSHVGALFRAVHTFKGNSRVLGLGVVESRAHLAEDLIGLIRDQGVPLDAEIHALLLETGDRLRSMLEATAATHADVDPAETEDLMERLRDKIARCTPASGQDEDTIEDWETAPAEVQAMPEPDARPEPDPVPEPEPAPVAEPQSAHPASKPGAPTRLADDPTYRAIFDSMVTDTLSRLRKHVDAGTPAPSRRVIGDLDHAAKQLGLDEWSARLCAYPADPSMDDVLTIISTIEGLNGSATVAAAPQPAAPSANVDGFFAQMAAPLSTVARLGLNFSTGEDPDPAVLAEVTGKIVSIADAAGYVRVSAAAADLTSAVTPVLYRRTELRLYEELASVEAVLGEDTSDAELSPAALLASWSADHVFDTLDELEAVLDRMRQGGDLDVGQEALERLVRLIHHACRHYGLETASQLAMSLLDLFGRGHARGQAPDAILMRISRGFVDTLELVFDALRAGEAPDTQRLEQLFAEASEAGFTGAGVMTATAIERKLGLPSEFHRVLSPESTRTAAEAMAAGHSFHILRADVNSDNDLAEALFGFIGSGKIKAITNVTVFRGQDTLFDFLISTSLDESDLSESLARLDPGGKRLVLTRNLTPVDDTAPEEAESSAADRTGDITVGTDLSAGVLERIGEIAAGQAMVHGIIAELAENDLSESVDAVMRLHGQDMRQASLALRGLAEGVMGRLRELAQLESQLLGQMAELQQTTAELRARPVESVLRPLAAMVATHSRRYGREAKMTTAGADMPLDIALLETLKSVLRPFLMARISQEDAAPKRLHLTVRRSDDQLSVSLEDDGGEAPQGPEMETVHTELSRAGGEWRTVKLPGGGRRFHISVPMNLVVLEGMVVGAGGTRYVLPVEAIRTILQPDPATLFNVAAQGGQQWLRLSKDEVIAIRDLPSGSAKTKRAAANGQTAAAGDHASQVHVVLGRAGHSVAIPVDDLVGQQLVLLRPLRGLMSKVRNVTGVALLSGGEVGMVLSPSALCGTLDAAESMV